MSPDRIVPAQPRETSDDEGSPTPILFAHGAGLPSSSPWMVAWAQRLGRLGRVATFDYPYVRAGRRLPDRLPVLLEAHRQALVELRAGGGGRPILAGKSMGSRVSCHLALEEPVAAVVCFGYPLVSAGKRRVVRDEVLLALTTPVLFVQGTRDRLCPLADLEAVRRRMKADSSVTVVEGGDHSLRVGKRALRASGQTQEQVDEAILDAIARFLAGC